MSRLPVPGQDDGVWGTLLNEYLSTAHNTDGSLNRSAVNVTGDVTGTLSNTSVTKIKGVSVSGTPSSGQVITASGPTAATWATVPTSDLSMLSTNNPTTADVNLNSHKLTNVSDPISGQDAATKYYVDNVAASSGVDYFNVKSYGAAGNGSTNDSASIQSAIDAAYASGGGTVYFPTGKYALGSSLIPKSNVTLLGSGNASVLKPSFTGNAIHATTVTFSHFCIDNMTFEGTVNQFPTTPTRARTTSGPGCQTAVYIDANLNPYNSSGGVVANFTMRRCIVRNCSALPIRIGGLSGTVRVVDNSFYNNQDVGFIYNKEVIFSNNHIEMSADNGVSISRGNNKITCTGNTIENCAYNGIWLTGFDNGTHNTNLIGPTNFSCSGNVITNVGFNGIICDQAPQNGNITGNNVNQGYNRGASDEAVDTVGVGIFIGGFPSSNRSTPTVYASNLNVTGNTLYQCARAGILVTGAKAVMVDANLILNCGTQYLSDGVSVINASDATQNIGILLDAGSISTDIVVRNNTVLEERITPLTNLALVPQSPPSSYVYFYNHMAGCRNAYNLVDFQSATRDYGNAIRFDGVTKHVAGATAGSNGGTGTIAAFDINGAAGSVRRNKIFTANSSRWSYGATGDTESGSNQGSNFVIQSFDDAGTTLANPLTITRSTGNVALSAGLAVTGTVTTAGLKVTTNPVSGNVLTSDANGNATWQAATVASGLTVTALKTSAYTALTGQFVPVDATSSSVTITLPTNPANASLVAVKLVDTASAHTVTVVTSGSDTFNKAGGVSAATLSLLNQAIVLRYQATGGIWYVESDDLPLSQLDTRYVDQISAQTAIGGAKTFTAVLTPAAGIVPVTTGFTAFGTGGFVNVLNVSSGTSVGTVAGSLYWAAVFIPFNVSLTGVVFSIGSVGGTDKWIGAIYNSNGALIASSTVAGTTVLAANTKMKLPFTSTATVSGPGVYYLALQSNGTTARFLAMSNTVEGGFVTGSTTGTFGTLSSFTPGTAYIQNIGPYANTY